MIIKDDRTTEQRNTHRYLIVGTDSFMSGWGQASGGASYAAWACETSEEVDKAMAWVSNRSDMKRVRLVIESNGYRYRPNANLCAHLHIYVWSDR